jgi:ADP-ribosylglycohydrolase
LRAEPFIGCLLGTAAGDALGLPYEGLSPRRVKKLFPDTRKHHLLFGKGMVSDDTEHAAFVAQAIIRSQGDVEAFRKHLARSLHWWLAGLPAGIGLATGRAIFKLWIGVSPNNSGVFSAGNGPAMRSAILGVAFGSDGEKLKQFVRASTRITHTDPKAYYAALAVAIAAINVVSVDDDDWREDYLHSLDLLMPEQDAGEFKELVGKALRSAIDGETLEAFATSIGSKNGISGYCYHTVPCVLQAWFRHGDNLRSGLPDIIEAGGDTDTAGAIFGAIVGARAEKPGIPEGWLDDIVEWPRSIRWLERLGKVTADSLDDGAKNIKAPGYPWVFVLPRNVVFLLVVLLHGLRRVLPPY